MRHQQAFNETEHQHGPEFPRNPKEGAMFDKHAEPEGDGIEYYFDGVSWLYGTEIYGPKGGK